MSYALVVDGQIQTEGSLPASAASARHRRVGHGTRRRRRWSCSRRAATSRSPTTERPPDTETETTDRSLELVDGTPTETWTVRPKTQEEIDAATASENQKAIVTNLEEDMANMDAILAMTNADINANPAAVIKEICRMNKRLGRTALNDYTGVD